MATGLSAKLERVASLAGFFSYDSDVRLWPIAELHSAIFIGRNWPTAIGCGSQRPALSRH
jgi:hypothetical protein